MLLEEGPVMSASERGSYRTLGEIPTPPREALTPDDLAGFLAIMPAEDVAPEDLDSSPFLREVMGPIVTVRLLPDI